MAYNCKTKNSYWSVLEIDVSLHPQHFVWLNLCHQCWLWINRRDKSSLAKLPLPRGTAELKHVIYIQASPVNQICRSIWIVMFLSMFTIHLIEHTIQNLLITDYISVTHNCMVLLFSDIESFYIGGGGSKVLTFHQTLILVTLCNYHGQPISITDTKLNQVNNTLNEKNCS